MFEKRKKAKRDENFLLEMNDWSFFKYLKTAVEHNLNNRTSEEDSKLSYFHEDNLNGNKVKLKISSDSNHCVISYLTKNGEYVDVFNTYSNRWLISDDEVKDALMPILIHLKNDLKKHHEEIERKELDLRLEERKKELKKQETLIKEIKEIL